MAYRKRLINRKESKTSIDITLHKGSIDKGPTKSEKQSHPLERASFFSNLFYCWVNQCIEISKNHPWQKEFNYKLPKIDSVEPNSISFQKSLIEKGTIGRAILKTWNYFFWITMLLNILSMGLNYSVAYILILLINDIEADHPDSDQRFTLPLLLGSIIITQIFECIIRNYNIFYTNRVILRIRSAVTSIILDKTLKASLLNPNKFTEGQILNFASADVQKFDTVMRRFLWSVNCIIGLTIGLVSIGFIAGYAIFGCLIVFTTSAIIIII